MRNNNSTIFNIGAFFVIALGIFVFMMRPFDSATPQSQPCVPTEQPYRGFVRKGMKSYNGCNDNVFIEYDIRREKIIKQVLKHFPKFMNHFEVSDPSEEREINSPLPEKYRIHDGYFGVEFNIISVRFNEMKVKCYEYQACDPVLPEFELGVFKPKICALAIDSFKNFPEFNMYRFWFVTDDNLTHWVFRFMADRMTGVTQEKCLKNFDQLGYHGKKGVFFKKSKIPKEFFDTYNKYKNSPVFYQDFQKYVMKVKIPGYEYGISCGSKEFIRGKKQSGGGGGMKSTDALIDDWRENTDFRRALLLILRAAKSGCNAPSAGLGNADSSISLSLMPQENLNAYWDIINFDVFPDLIR
jgi:hypothetical protein